METIIIYSANTEIARELVSAGRMLGSVTALALDEITANDLAATGTDVALYEGTEVIPADTAAVAQIIARAVAETRATVVLLGSDRRGKELTGRVAAELGAGCLSDVKSIAVENGVIVCTRLSFGGATIATETITSPIKVIAVSPMAFEMAEAGASGVISSFGGEVAATIKVVGERAKVSEGVDLKAAEVIVAVGEGVEAENVALADKLAQALGGVLACTKPTATDRKLLSEERVIGLSGAITKPNLAIVIGISGQAQFSVGIRDAKTIISINTDKNADMNRMSDYFMVKDSGEAIAELCEKLV